MDRTDQLRERIAELMGWTFDDTTRFSLPALRDFVRGKDPKFDEELREHIDMGLHFFKKPSQRK